MAQKIPRYGIGCGRVLGVSDELPPVEAPPEAPAPVQESPAGDPPAAEPPSFPKPAPPPVSEVPLDDERAMLAAMLPGSAGKELRGDAKRILGGSTALGRFVASRMLETPSFRQSSLIYARAKAANIDGASMTVARFYNELGKPNPNKVVLDGCLAVMRGTGIMVDSVPVSQVDRAKQIDEDREAASMTNSELMTRQAERLRLMSGGKEGA